MELREKSDEYAELSTNIKTQIFKSGQTRKNTERVLRFLLIIEFWMEQGDNGKAFSALQDLKRIIKQDLS